MPEKSHAETLDLTKNNIMSSDIESDEDDKDHPPTWSKKRSTSGSLIKRSSPVQVYTYKVNYF